MKYFRKWQLYFPFLLLAAAVIFFVQTRGELQYGSLFTERSTANMTHAIGEIKKGDEVEQRIVVQADEVTGVSILLATYDRQNDDVLDITISSGDDGEVLFSCDVPTQTLQDNALYALPMDEPLEGVRDRELIVRISSQQGDYGNAVTAYYNDGPGADGKRLSFNGETLSGALSMEITGKNKVPFTQMYWAIVAFVFVLCAAYLAVAYRRKKRGQTTWAERIVSGLAKYSFLLRQLVIRDFKTKYKRSVLGMLWSLLNPLLTMTVQYIVFSRLFRFEIQNYPVYLLSGIVFFNYMSDATSQGLMCIIQNASLINKVYVPKYIYPLSRVLSCGVNFILSLVALYIMILCTGIHVTAEHIFVLYGVICTVMFSLGMALFLSSLMVYFRDIQFLYGVFLQMWLYLTPLFYPETILPDWVMRVVEFNPMYHFIRFIRIIILQGVLPEFRAWVFCAVFSIVPLAIGCMVFRRAQKKFILYI